MCYLLNCSLISILLITSHSSRVRIGFCFEYHCHRINFTNKMRSFFSAREMQRPHQHIFASRSQSSFPPGVSSGWNSRVNGGQFRGGSGVCDQHTAHLFPALLCARDAHMGSSSGRKRGEWRCPGQRAGCRRREGGPHHFVSMAVGEVALVGFNLFS